MQNTLSLNIDETKFGLFRKLIKSDHGVKSVRIRRFSGRYFPAFPHLSVFNPNARKYDQKNSKYGHFSRSSWSEIEKRPIESSREYSINEHLT